MPVSEIEDPRLEELFGAEAAAAAGVKPFVRLRRAGPPNWAIAAFALSAALLLFWVLESRHQPQPEPQVRPPGETPAFSPEPPPLYIPPAPLPQPQVDQSIVPAPAPARSEIPARPMPVSRPPVVYEQPLPRPAWTPSRPPQASSGPALVIDSTAPAATPSTAGGTSAGASSSPFEWGGRARGGTLANRSNTVPQGAMIAAVLETAFDSTGAGLARAIVSRDVRGFDGKKVLIPRGSHLVGKYGPDTALGQNRALITWTRLLRPDGVTVELDSPATDALGRGGVRARTNSHFWTRLGEAILHSAANIGTALGTRAATGSIIVSMPGSGQQSGSSAQTDRVVPTLSIKAGTSISVFVARDLEFSDGQAE